MKDLLKIILSVFFAINKVLANIPKLLNCRHDHILSDIFCLLDFLEHFTIEMKILKCT